MPSTKMCKLSNTSEILCILVNFYPRHLENNGDVWDLFARISRSVARMACNATSNPSAMRTQSLATTTFTGCYSRVCDANKLSAQGADRMGLGFSQFCMRDPLQLDVIRLKDRTVGHKPSQSVISCPRRRLHVRCP
jgi:hypothetical protein